MSSSDSRSEKKESVDEVLTRLQRSIDMLDDGDNRDRLLKDFNDLLTASAREQDLAEERAERRYDEGFLAAIEDLAAMMREIIQDAWKVSVPAEQKFLPWEKGEGVWQALGDALAEFEQPVGTYMGIWRAA